jgi:hypothetical protein
MRTPRTFLLDCLRHGPVESAALYETANDALGLAGPQITAELLALNVDVTDRGDGRVLVSLPRNLFAIWWAKLRPTYVGAGGNAA